MTTTHTALLTIPLLLLNALASVAADWPQWRGPERNAISSETGLLQQWPQPGPKLAWKVSNVGSGYSTPAVVGDRLYLLANEGLEHEFVRALSTRDGGVIWSTRLGKVGNPQQKPNFPGVRSTPTVAGQFLYALGSDGDLACIETGSGSVRWLRNLRTDFGGKPGTWAYSESPLVDGEAVLCTPGGGEATLLALNRETGEPIWKCPLPEADEAGYASAIMVDAAGTRQYVQLLQKGLVGVEAKTGRLLWRYPRVVSRYGANIPTPVASGNAIYAAASGTGGGLVELKRSEDGVVAEEKYFEAKLPTAIGGAVKVGEWLFGTTGQAMLCIEFATGQVKWEERALAPAALCYADGRLYLHGENGEAALVEPSPDGYNERGRFSPPDQPKRSGPMEKAWTHPVVAYGHLYLRDQNMLWCYDVRAAQPPAAK